MYLRYGSYAHDNNEVWYHLDAQTQFGQTGAPFLKRVRVVIVGVKHGASTSDLTAKLLELENAYVSGNYDLIFLDNDNSTELVHTIRAADTVSGWNVVHPVHYTDALTAGGSGSEYTFRRSFRVVLECHVLTTEFNTIQFHESLTTIGTGGADFEILTSRLGQPAYQGTMLATPYVVVQSGRAVGAEFTPTPPSPIWPSVPPYKPRLTRIGQFTPQLYFRNQNLGWGVSWSYTFHSTVALTGSPSGF